LDFLVVADHASNMGLMQKFEDRAPVIMSSISTRTWLENFEELSHRSDDALKWSKFLMRLWKAGPILEAKEQSSIWEGAIELANLHNTPGLFTAFIGYEWTQTFYDLHRVVIFKDGAELVKNTTPFSQYDSTDPEDFWRYLESYERQTGGEVLAIPHNGNLSRGLMFSLENAKGERLSKQYARTRSRWEPLFEVTQIKGDSETHPLISKSDTFADYERLEYDCLKPLNEERNPQGLDWRNNEKRMLSNYDSWLQKKRGHDCQLWNAQYGYARSGLKLGLKTYAALGVNPFKFGMAGGTDAHTSMSTADDNNFWGKLTWNEPYPNRIKNSWLGSEVSGLSGFFADASRMSASGYTGVWAAKNTRESIFSAMKRKEVYASTGPRILVRFFGGWDYKDNDAFKSDFVRIGYEKGVPMGGDLTQAPEHKVPSFLIRAVKDADGANLDRVQVIKGWHDINGELHEKIYNVALSDNRKPNWRGKIKPVGNTVTLADASYTNTIGDPELSVVWKDPDFNPDELAFYYLRVLEIPTPRWTAYDAKHFQLTNTPSEVTMVTQERAYTSPIWYTPTGKSKVVNNEQN